MTATYPSWTGHHVPARDLRLGTFNARSSAMPGIGWARQAGTLLALPIIGARCWLGCGDQLSRVIGQMG
jgi:hypothetical protein